jgi:CheY-like chemotaxis protein
MGCRWRDEAGTGGVAVVPLPICELAAWPRAGRRQASRLPYGLPGAGRIGPPDRQKNDMSALRQNDKDLPDATPGVRNVLVVDDNVDAADSLGDLLRAWGYHVTVAHDGPAALAAMQDTLPDIALLDIDMPAMDGYELAAHLRFQPGCESLPIVAITGEGGLEAMRRSRAKGFSAHLVKPVSPARLKTLLK